MLPGCRLLSCLSTSQVIHNGLETLKDLLYGWPLCCILPAVLNYFNHLHTCDPCQTHSIQMLLTNFAKTCHGQENSSSLNAS